MLKSFCEACPDLAGGYLAADRMKFCPDASLVSASEYPELLPYRSLDPTRLKLVGEGKWPMERYLDSVLWLPFVEPAFLMHGFDTPADGVPNFKAEKPEDCLTLAKVWDARGLLFLAEEPLVPGYFSRVFNAYKSPEKDRQIGDRRLPNMCEFHVDGPSKHLPQGQQLVMLRLPRFTHALRGSMSDRRDFYHQAAVTPQRARTNMLPFCYPLDSFKDTQAWTSYVDRQAPASTAREVVGDHLKGDSKTKSRLQPEMLYPCFNSLFQGDHLGVEFALCSHETLLKNHGLLCSDTRIQGHLNFPVTTCWDALVIDDYFCLSADHVHAPVAETFAFSGLSRARDAYDQEKLLGSPEKDVVAETSLKAAGAEIRSSEKNVRLGFVPVSAPLAKRLALSVLSLRASDLPGLSAGVCARLAGNWVSVLQFRKCWSSLIDGLFLFASKCQQDPGSLFSMPRSIAQELVMLASVAPLIVSNIAVDYLEEFYASDASNQKGAIVRAPIAKSLHEVLWLDADKKGHYSALDHPFRALLRQTGNFDLDESLDSVPALESPWKAPMMYFDFVEICGGAGKVTDALSNMGFVCAPTLDLSESEHYDLSSLRLLEWIIFMLEENRFRSFLIEPPCTSFSPAAHPAVRSYREPLGFDRLNPKTLHGNILAFRSLVLLRVARRHRRPCGLEQSRLSKMAWLQAWRSLLEMGFSEAVIASCQFQSIHRKEFRLLCYLLDTAFLDCRCPGGHAHVRIEGSYTKPSAIYTDALALHLAQAFRLALRKLDADTLLEPEVEGHETIMSNDLMLTSKWEVVRSWFWKRLGHINVLEMSSAVSNLVSVGKQHSSVRFCSLVDSAVCRGAFCKGRSSPRALQPLLRKTGAVCVAGDLYPGWIYSPTRLNCADDPTRQVPLRPAQSRALVAFPDLLPVLRALNLKGLKKFAANWIRLTLFLVMHGAATGEPLPADPWTFASGLETPCLSWTFGDSTHWSFPSASLLWSCVLVLTCAVLTGSWLTYGFCHAPKTPKSFAGRSFNRSHFLIFAAAMVLCPFGVCGMPLAPTTAAERSRAQQRSGNVLASTRAVKAQTREKRRIYLDRFKVWLWTEKSISFKFLIECKPPDPERIADLLIDYGRDLYASGGAYGIYAETINAVAVERPLVRRQLNAAWDLAFVWLMDEPHQHHPAMPIAVMAAMVALGWGWAYEAAVILLGWTGILRIGEILAACRKELVLPCDAVPGTTFALLIIRHPKTRGRTAKHQAARIDQEDVIAYLTAMYGNAKPGARLWPFSAATLRKRFTHLLEALRLPTKRTESHNPFDLGSLRPGGATWMLHALESPEAVQRRGRWASARTMEIYLQEVLVVTYVERLSQRTRELIRIFAGGYAILISRCIFLLDSGIPTATWFSLLKAAGGLERSTESMG